MLQKLNSNSYVAGLKQSLKAIQSGKASKVLLASDADYFLSSKVSDACLANKVPVIGSYTKSQLGKMCRLDVDTAVVALLSY